VTGSEAFPVVVLREFAVLVRDRGFVVIGQDDWTVRFESSVVGVEASFDPRGGASRWVGVAGSKTFGSATRSSATRRIEAMPCCAIESVQPSDIKGFARIAR